MQNAQIATVALALLLVISITRLNGSPVSTLTALDYTIANATSPASSSSSSASFCTRLSRPSVSEDEWDRENLLRFREFMEHFMTMGEMDASYLAWLLRPIAARYDPSEMLVVDVGANVGQTATALLRALNSHDCRRWVATSLLGGAGAEGERWRVCDERRGVIPIFSFEPDPRNVLLLRQRAAEKGWSESGWHLVEMAVSIEPGKADFFLGASTEHSSLSSQWSGTGTRHPVEVTSLDHFLSNSPEAAGRRPFLVKIDTEGFDPDVIAGAALNLAAHRIKFLLFEYNDLWRTMLPPGTQSDVREAHTLHRVVATLGVQGYACVLLGARGFVPVTPDAVWHEQFEYWRWSNVFCGLRRDPDFCEVLIEGSPDSAVDHMKNYAALFLVA